MCPFVDENRSFFLWKCYEVQANKGQFFGRRKLSAYVCKNAFSLGKNVTLTFVGILIKVC